MFLALILVAFLPVHIPVKKIIRLYPYLCISVNTNYILKINKRSREREWCLQPGARGVGEQGGRRAGDTEFPPGLTAARPEHPAMPAASCPFQRTPPLTLGSDSLGEQMPGSMGAGGLRKWLFVWGTQPVCLMGEGLAASVTGPDS